MGPLRIILFAAAAYQSLAILAALKHLSKRRSRPPSELFSPGVSVLKPVYGSDPNTFEAFLSQVEQHYPAFEILFGARDPDDAAVREVVRLQRAFPAAPVRLVLAGTSTPNGKVGVLIELARNAQYPIWVVNDSDIKVDSEYLSEIVAPLSDLKIGLVTCLYRVKPQSVPAAWEALGIATDFMPSTLVAQLLGVRDFGLGSTLAFRAADFEQAGGFASIAEYLADDYQLARRICSRGKRAFLSTYTVETTVGDGSWVGVWLHQLRWARTIRVSKGAGYAGLPITQAGVWISVALCCGAWPSAIVLAALRIGSAFLSGWCVLRSGIARTFFWLAPVWDLYAFAVWLASYAGSTVRWRDKTLVIDREGRIRT